MSAQRNSAERFAIATRIFNKACKLASGEQEAYLQDACTNDSALYELAKGLLNSDSDPENLLDQSLEISFTSETDPVGKAIGSYELLKKLDHGGMGVVYLAKLVDKPFTKEVALKIIHNRIPELRERAEARFRREMQILARFEHEFIARLYDGGITENNQHYLVMEYIRGLPIDKYIKNHSLALDDRLRLFQKVCTAVQAAHNALVIHCDLKPDNILVVEGATPKLLDFGVAKMIDDELDQDRPERFSYRRRFMTPQFASPEMRKGEIVTTVSDIYSLGIILHRLVTNQYPFTTDKSSLEKTAKVILQHPAGPSVILQNRKLRDLDAIIFKAIDEAPTNRYRTVQEFSQDIDHFLKGEPVHSVQPTISYKFARFARRYAFILSTIVLLIVMSLIFGVHARVQSRKIAEERDHAQEIADFLANIFRVTDPNLTKGSAITAFDLLDSGVKWLAEEIEQQPIVRAQLSNVIGSAYFRLGDYNKAEKMLAGALTIREQALRQVTPGWINNMLELSAVYRAQDQLIKADSIARKAIDKTEKQFGNGNLLTAASLTEIGMVLLENAEYDKAEEALLQALEIRMAVAPNLNQGVADNFNDLGLIMRRKGDWDSAQKYYDECLRINVRINDKVHTKTATILNNLAVVNERKGSFSAADSLHRQALKIWTQLLGPRHPEVQTSRNNLGVLLRKRGRYDEAEYYCRKALAGRQDIYGEFHRLVALSFNNLAFVYAKMCRYEQADSLFKHAITSVDSNNPLVPIIQGNWAAVLSELDKLGQAEKLLKEALVRSRMEFGDSHWRIARYLNTLGTNQLRQKDHTSAEKSFKESIRMLRKTEETRDFRLASSLYSLASLYKKLGRIHEAKALFEETLAMRRKTLDHDHPDILSSLIALSEFFIVQKEYPKAEELLEEAVWLSLERNRSPNWYTSQAKSALGACYAAQNRLEEAEVLLVESVTNLEEVPEIPKKIIRKTFENIINFYHAVNKPKEVLKYQEMQARQLGFKR